jgi:acetyltransferase-like isoleucine patch superfamily enzyme
MVLGIIQKILYKASHFNNLLFYYFIPNIKNIFKKKIFFSRTPTFNTRFYSIGLGNVYLGRNCVFGSKFGGFHKNGYVELITRVPSSRITLGDSIWTNNNISIICQNDIKIGSQTLIGQNVTIMDFEGHQVDPDSRKEMGYVGIVDIGENVWIGNNVIILKNTVIGKNSIVAAGAIVTGRFPENVIIGGVPAKVIKSIGND